MSTRLKRRSVFVTGFIIIPILFFLFKTPVFSGEEERKDKNLVLYWSFDEGNLKKTDTGYRIMDSSVYKNDGVSTGGEISEGTMGEGLKLDKNKEEYITVFDNGAESLQFTDKITVTYWVRFTTVPRRDEKNGGLIGGIGQCQTLFCGRGILNYRGYWVIEAQFIMPGTPWSDNVQVHPGGGEIPDRWDMIAITYDGSLPEKNFKAYSNGILRDTGNKKADFLEKSNDKEISFGLAYAFAGYFDGVVDELKIYNRALTLEEIKKELESNFE